MLLLHASHDTIRMARLAKETGLFPVYEAEHGEVTRVSPIRRRAPVEDYQRPQRRFAHLFNPAPRLEVISNVTAAPHTEDSPKALLVQQIVRPVRWLETMQRLSAIPDAVFEEVGPGTVLSGLLARIRAAA